MSARLCFTALQCRHQKHTFKCETWCTWFLGQNKCHQWSVITGPWSLSCGSWVERCHIGLQVFWRQPEPSHNRNTRKTSMFNSLGFSCLGISPAFQPVCAIHTGSGANVATTSSTNPKFCSIPLTLHGSTSLRSKNCLWSSSRRSLMKSPRNM